MQYSGGVSVSSEVSVRHLMASGELLAKPISDAGMDLPTQKLQAARQVPLMFSDLTDRNGFGSWTDEAVAANIETLALLGREVTPDLWDRSILDEVHGR